ncbi:uncharacterized protein BP5553_09260 [Venustampulla echinocandica]|uniref:Uncharacterized protein n=1 Tax=Venustampulla echinocandica TaxID=2656787 RepID=A0A370TC78_9HELO|nr:uncharacterized protein BP5553_09260 [Venustampulla echinocandica]RDL31858.1 hypothetical protein BP5553_09260 [Venustampulla echinocandica]
MDGKKVNPLPEGRSNTIYEEETRGRARERPAESISSGTRPSTASSARTDLSTTFGAILQPMEDERRRKELDRTSRRPTLPSKVFGTINSRVNPLPEGRSNTIYEEETRGRARERQAESISSGTKPSTTFEEILQPMEDERRKEELDKKTDKLLRTSRSHMLPSKVFGTINSRRGPGAPPRISRKVAAGMNRFYNDYKDAELGVTRPTTMPHEVPPREGKFKKVAKDILTRAKKGMSNNYGHDSEDDRPKK